MSNTEKILKIYQSIEGQEPFTNWLNSIKDKKLQNRILTRLDRVQLGNYGDYESVGEGVFELRFHFGPGYRIYFVEVDNIIVILLCGGDKSTQLKDILKAKQYFKYYKEHLDENI